MDRFNTYKEVLYSLGGWGNVHIKSFSQQLDLRDILWLWEHWRRHFRVSVSPGITVTEAERTVTISPVTSMMMRRHVEVTHCHTELIRDHRVLVMIEAVMMRREASRVCVQLGQQLRG